MNGKTAILLNGYFSKYEDNLTSILKSNPVTSTWIEVKPALTELRNGHNSFFPTVDHLKVFCGKAIIEQRHLLVISKTISLQKMIL